MALDSKHPHYSLRLEDWVMMRDTYAGERAVKDKGQVYLPATSGMVADGMNFNQPGYLAYSAYKTRAVFHGFISEAVRTLVGVMHHKPPVIELPESMEPMRQNATIDGESLEMLLRRINEAQLTTGRLGLLLDIPSTPIQGKAQPYIAAYKAESVINWDHGARDQLTVKKLNLVVLDESEQERDQAFEWKLINKWRVLVLGDAGPNEAKGVYSVGVFREAGTAFNEEALTTPSIMGKTLDQIPFVFVNPSDIVPDPDEPPLANLARLSLAIYRGEADYRQALFMQGQDTLVVSGDNPNQDGTAKSYRTGANAVITLPTAGKAEFIGAAAEGLDAQEKALTNDKNAAKVMAGQMMDNQAKGVESGEALEIRVGARTAGLNETARTGAYALQSILRIAAVWMGADPEKVVVTPNMDFADASLVEAGTTVVSLQAAKNTGAPISLRTIHKVMKDSEITELSYEEELKEIEGEEALVEPPSATGSPAEDEDENEE